MDARRTQPRDDQVAPFKVGMGSVRAQGGTARVPAEVMQFIADIREIQPVDNAAVRLGGWIDIDDQQGVAARFAVRRQSGNIRETLARRFHGEPSSWIERRVRRPSEARLTKRWGLRGLLGLGHRNNWGLESGYGDCGTEKGIRREKKSDTR